MTGPRSARAHASAGSGPTRRQPPRGRLGAIVLVSALVGCAGEPPRAPLVPDTPAWTPASRAEADALGAILAAEPAPRDGSLTIRLAFGDDADLDLYVSDPQQETVYYANTPARSGGGLTADRNCQNLVERGARIEEIVFPGPLPGRYRIGVDYPHRCRSGAGVAPWALTIDGAGSRRALTGLAEPIVFTPIVIEIEIERNH